MSNGKLITFLVLAIALLAAGLISGSYFDEPASEKQLAGEISRSLDKALQRMNTEATLLMKDPLGTRAWEHLEDSFFLIDSLSVARWTTNDFLPDLRTVHGNFTLKLIQVPQGEFLVRKWPMSEQIFLVGVLPLHRDYEIVNNYLGPVWNNAIFPSPVKILKPDEEGEPICLPSTSAAPNLNEASCLFKIRLPERVGMESNFNGIALAAIALASVSFLLFVGGLARRFHKQRKYGAAFFTMLGCIGLLRIVMVKLNYPNVYSDFTLFDPHRFASSSFNASMGDLLLNSLCVLVLCLYIFITYPAMPLIRRVMSAPPAQRFAAAVACLFVSFLSLLYPYLFMEIVYHNSSISLEISDSVSFDGIRWVAFLSLLIGCVSAFLFIHMFFRLTGLLTGQKSTTFWLAWLVSGGMFALFFLATQKAYWITLAVGMAYFAILFIGRILQQFNRFTFKTFLYFLVVILVLACQGALSLRKFNNERSVRDQFRFGNKFLVDQDVLGEYLLNESALQIGRDPFIQAVLTNPFVSKNSVRQKINQVYLGTYFDRYDIQVHLFNASGEAFGSEVAPNFATLIRNYQGETYKTAYPGIYFVNTPTQEVTQQYLVIVPVKRHQLSAGFVVLNLRLKKVIPRSVYPELLVDNRFSHYFMGKEFSYAFFSHGKLTNSFGEFNYDNEFNMLDLENLELYSLGISGNGFHHIAIEDSNGQTAIVTAREYSLFSLVTNFCFLFVLGLLAVLLVLLIASAITWWTGARLDYAARVQLYVYLAFFLPLVTVSLTTLSLASRTAEEQMRREYDERSRAFGEIMARPMGERIKDPGNWSESQITELAKLADLDASVYGTNGRLLASSQPLIFENRLTSPLMNRKAWKAIVQDNKTAFITTENIGKLKYNNSYVAIKSAESGAELGVLSIPFFGSAQSLEKIQINVLANILTTFVLVFILFSVLSFLIANGLTFPLRFITKSIKRTTLTGKNQVIQWNSNDEIGLLASEYNRMIRNLEQSRYELARVQKETAWREIAKQVAHEIKNPLTPMKLTLQQMQLFLDNNELEPEKTRKAVETLLTQLEILNEIATSFSTFARMPAPVFEKIDIDSLLKNVVSLHQTNPAGTVTLKLETGSAEVLGNGQLLGRAFGNIILNALQSGKEGRKVHVQVSAGRINGTCLVRFADDGRGIEAAIRDKVFLPHFSTKHTGSGLGLAIAKEGIEQTGGRVWFETSERGTIFFIELVLAAT